MKNRSKKDVQEVFMSFLLRHRKKILQVIKRYPQIRKNLKSLSLALRRLPFVQIALSALHKKWVKPFDLDAPTIFFGERLISRAEWSRRRALHQDVSIQFPNDVSVKGEFLERPVISVLISLYKSDEYLISLLSSIQGQSIKEKAEFIFILVQPSDFTVSLVNEFRASLPHVQILRHDDRIGIYAAWNEGIKIAQSEIITNWNADDTRAPDSLEIQYNYLNSHPKNDVVYQDVYYSLEPNLSWETLQAIGMRSNLPDVSAQYLLETSFNLPHNAPAWRRKLHEDYGYFDESYMSAGDYEFWVRIALHNRRFSKLQQIHVAYFINPKGISTIPGNPGRAESDRVIATYLPALMPNLSTTEKIG